MPDKLTNSVKEISSQAMPVVDVPNISPDIFNDENKKIEISFLIYQDLGILRRDKILKNLTENYNNWIDRTKKETEKLDQKYQSPSKIIIENCENAFDRIQKGIELINKDDQINWHFKLQMRL